ncbi:Cytochrome P450 1A2 [Stylophora pistillata]|uniref:Cytochrome P450 1A2 n=1 Tax=Stylophora pistillata TaxID=50429 RepID=A0A2B4S4L2_STYPI|nr:Cytochrome P450 1A2 [Stylophora pistillata]
MEEVASQLTGQTGGLEAFLPEDARDASRTEAASLPDLAGEVAVAQRQQINELSQRQEVRDRLKLKINSVKSDLAAVSRKIYLTEEEVSKKKAWCEELDKDVTALVASESKLIKELAIANDKLERDRQLYKRYRKKMAGYTQQLTECKKNHPIYKSIAEQKAKNVKLSEELERLRSLGYESKLKNLKAELAKRKERKKQLEESAALNKSKEQEENDRLAQLTIETLQEQEENDRQAQLTKETLQTRNKARLVRMKSQWNQPRATNTETVNVGCIAAFMLLIWGWYKTRRDIPPGPFGLPLIGSLLQLGDSPHLALSRMAKVYGNVFSIRLGWRKAIVLNSQDVVKETLSKRAGHFSGRPPFHSFKISKHQSESIVFGDFDTSHHKKKKLAARALHSVFSDVNRFDILSHQEFERMQCCLLTDGSSEAQDLSPHLKAMVTNFAFRFVFGDNFQEQYSVALQSLMNRAADFSENNGAINLLDFFPWLHFLFKKQCQVVKDSVRELFDFVRSIYKLQRHASIKEAGVNVAASLDQIIREDLVND